LSSQVANPDYTGADCEGLAIAPEPAPRSTDHGGAKGVRDSASRRYSVNAVHYRSSKLEKDALTEKMNRSKKMKKVKRREGGQVIDGDGSNRE
jgi:hypothetical protein